MLTENKLYGLVVCGGKSSRMGQDKSMLTYHDQPQRYHLYHLLAGICEEVFISCNQIQEKEIRKDYHVLPDSEAYGDIGPMGALLTAYERYPGNDFLVVGCDYPFLEKKHLANFITSKAGKKMATAFCNKQQELYEPLLAWYSANGAELMKQMFNEKNYSLQYFLRENDAGKYFPSDPLVIKSIDTPSEFAEARALLKNRNNSK